MRRRAPTYRERWVKNDDSGTLGFFIFFKIKTQFKRELRFRFIQSLNKSKFCTKRGRAMRAPTGTVQLIA